MSPATVIEIVMDICWHSITLIYDFSFQKKNNQFLK